MHRITIEVGSHGVVTTVSEMRKRLAKILSNLPGDQEVFFSFVAHLDARPAPRFVPIIAPVPTILFGELARPENS